MHPRTIAILAGSILIVALVMRVVIHQAGLLPLSQEIVLKKATALTIAYATPAQKAKKTLTITDPAELADLLSVLDIDEGRHPPEHVAFRGGATAGPVTFHFPDGRSRGMFFTSPNWLGSNRVNPYFYAKLCALVSRAEQGRQVDLLTNNEAEP